MTSTEIRWYYVSLFFMYGCCSKMCILASVLQYEILYSLYMQSFSVVHRWPIPNLVKTGRPGISWYHRNAGSWWECLTVQSCTFPMNVSVVMLQKGIYWACGSLWLCKWRVWELFLGKYSTNLHPMKWLHWFESPDFTPTSLINGLQLGPWLHRGLFMTLQS